MLHDCKKFPIEKETSLSIPFADLCLNHSLDLSAVNKNKEGVRKCRWGALPSTKLVTPEGNVLLLYWLWYKTTSLKKSASLAKVLFKKDHSFEKLEVYGIVC